MNEQLEAMQKEARLKDRELLQLAAKAAGYEIAYWTEDSTGEVPVAVLEDGDYWQPLLLNTLTDCMGDALRLAVKLNMVITIDFDRPQNRVVVGADDNIGGVCIVEKDFNHPYAATRRAIVRAAAEIGKEVK